MASSMEQKMKILVLDDDRMIREAIKTSLSERYSLLFASTFDEAVKILNDSELDGAIIDLDLRDRLHDGIEFLQLFKKKFPNNPVVIESGQKDVPTVVKCMKLGAEDYVEKPFDIDSLRLKIDKVLADNKKTKILTRALEKENVKNQIIGRHEKVLNAKALVDKAAHMRILFIGETGVGKTPFAWYSNQVVNKLEAQVRPFEQLNCASLSKEYFQDQLFGHKKGGFTNAVSDKRGLVEIAQGGDLFLDEIGEMTLDIQALFLTFLDTMEYYRLGDDQKRKAQVRVLCATNRDLPKMVKEGGFRKDLYSRISQVEIHIPPLRERASDVTILFEHFIEVFAGFPKPYDPEVVRLFLKFRWEEGNVRELRDSVEYLCLSSRESDRIEMHHLSDRYRPIEESEIITGELDTVAPQVMQALLTYGLESYLGHVEKKLLVSCVKQSKGKLDTLATQLKISAPTLYRRIDKYNIPIEE